MKQLGDQSVFGRQARKLFWGSKQRARKDLPRWRPSFHAWTDTGPYLPEALYRAAEAHAPSQQQEEPRP